MQVSKRFLALLEQQLAQFTDRPDLQELVVYLAIPAQNGKPNLVPIGQWPLLNALPKADADQAADPEAPLPLGEARRWLPLRDGSLLLGAMRVEANCWPWPASLNERLEATARCLAEALRLDLDKQRLGHELARRDDQLRLLVHQLRNPLAALRTFGQLLRRRLEADPRNRDLVDQLLAEQGQMTRYVEAIDQLAAPASLAPADGGATPLLLPPGLSGAAAEPLARILAPLLERAAATAALQGRPWRGPGAIPAWQGDGAAVGEILANLLENAFRYCHAGGAIGLICEEGPASISVAVWDTGPPIPAAERETIFERGVRGSTGRDRPGTGLGLALGRDLARSLGGELELLVPPQQLDPRLPDEGNAFRLQLPADGQPADRSSS